MSHFVMGIIVPKEINANYEAIVEEQIQEFDEELKVEPYEIKCECNYCDIRLKATEETEKLFGKTRDELNAELNEIMANDKTEYSEIELWDKRQEVWKNLSSDFFAKKDELIEYYTPITPFQEDCEDCQGTGKAFSTYNPKSKWDWWSIGGRWGHLGKIQTIEFAKNNNAFFGFVTPEKEWIESAEMGWWGTTSNDKTEEEWQTIKDKLLEKYNDEEYMIIVVDCHI